MYKNYLRKNSNILVFQVCQTCFELIYFNLGVGSIRAGSVRWQYRTPALPAHHRRGGVHQVQRVQQEGYTQGSGGDVSGGSTPTQRTLSKVQIQKSTLPQCHVEWEWICGI